jgi:hypothetical protein
MKRWTFRCGGTIGAILVGLVIIAFGASGCFACFSLPAPGGSVNVGSESAVIVWNSVSKSEHFIRSATFNATGPDFGFIVPTPTVPTITSADPAAFTYIKQHILPGYAPDTPPPHDNSRDSPPMVLSLAPVEVLSQENVDGTQITTVSASDSDALGTWMTTNGFTWTRDMGTWLDPYIKMNWVITLFKYQKQDSSSNIVSSSLLDLTFHTTVLFFPYSEPASQRSRGNYARQRSLTVYIFSNCRMRGELEANPEKAVWPDKLLYTDRVDMTKLNTLLPLLNLHASDLPAHPWITVLHDFAAPRPGVADVIFEPSVRKFPAIVLGLQDRVDNLYY